MKYFFNNFWLKILSVFVAVFLFLLVRSDRETTFTRTAEITFVTQENMVVVGENPIFLNVDLRLMNTLFAFPPTDKQLEAKVMLKSKIPGKYNISLNREDFNNLPPYYLVSFTQGPIEVELDELWQIQVPIRVVFEEDTLPKSLVIEKLKQDASQVVLSGPKKALLPIRFLDTVPVTIPQSSGDYNIEVMIDKKKFLQHYSPSVNATPETTQVSFTLAPAPQLRTFHSVPIQIDGKLKSERSYFEFRPNVVDVIVAGNPENLSNLTPDDVRVTVKAQELTMGWNEAQIKVNVPKGIRVEDIQPNQVSVFVSHR